MPKILNIPSKYCPRLRGFCQRVKFSPNLGTLVGIERTGEYLNKKAWGVCVGEVVLRNREFECSLGRVYVCLRTEIAKCTSEIESERDCL